MSVDVDVVTRLTVRETLANIPFAGSKTTILHSGMDDSVTLDASSTPAATKVADFQKALSGGTGTIDLTSISGSQGTFDGTGLKVRAVKFRNPATNANDISVTFGASNAYLLLGTGWKVTLKPGQYFETYLKDGAPSIDSSHKNIDLAGTASQALDCLIVLG